ncbi:MAG TPA: hypothetical protein VF543_05640 [Pyrinomonadaceae bacterium]|jgi:hypothetical protein
MQSISLHKPETDKEPLDIAGEIARLEQLLDERRRELAALQEEMRVFKARYTEAVGSRLAELAEIEREIKQAKARMLGLEDESAEEETGGDEKIQDEQTGPVPVGRGLRKLFWAVAKMFHPDHAADEREARARHTVMAEASRAYREGDVESLHTLLGDEQLQSLCAVGGVGGEETDDLNAKLLALEIELRTVEFGIKRIRQDGLYHTRLKVEEEAREGRDALSQMAEQIDRQIVKARHRLAHLS